MIPRRRKIRYWLLTGCWCATSLLAATACGRHAMKPLRVATFNIRELSTAKLTEVDSTGQGRDEQALAAARIIQRVRPDILVLNEIDHDYGRAPGEQQVRVAVNAERFVQAYLARGPEAISYPYIFAAPCNTGILTGLDLDRDGRVATAADRGTRVHGGDCFGYGTYPGQYSMALLSKYPIGVDSVRTFQRFLWKDLPGNHIPPGYYTDEALAIFRLSSKSHWDVPVRVGGRTLHLLISHPTPPAFDGQEDRNGRRNFDEIKFWVLYLRNDPALYDDAGRRGGLTAPAPFIIAGDLNASPAGDAVYDNQTAIAQLLGHPRLFDTGPLLTSAGAAEDRPPGPPAFFERSTAKFGQDFRTRVDYLLPSTEVHVRAGGVFWPAAAEDPEGARLAETASDHRLVWIDVQF